MASQNSGGTWTPQQIREHFMAMPSSTSGTGFNDTFNDIDDNTIQTWIDKGLWDQANKRFIPEDERSRGRIDYTRQTDYKPTDCPAGETPLGTGGRCVPNEDFDPQTGAYRPGAGAAGAGAGAGNNGDGSSGAFSSNVPQFNYTPFQAPSYESAMQDPGYQFALREGADQLQRGQAAQGVLRTSGSLKGLLNYGQQAAAQQYGNVYDRALSTWGAQYQGQKDAYAPQYGAWQTQYGGDLSRWTTRYQGDLARYLNRENNIYGLLNSPPPTAPTYGG